jgi:hypothetical protein
LAAALCRKVLPPSHRRFGGTRGCSHETGLKLVRKYFGDAYPGRRSQTHCALGYSRAAPSALCIGSAAAGFGEWGGLDGKEESSRAFRAEGNSFGDVFLGLPSMTRVSPSYHMAGLQPSSEDDVGLPTRRRLHAAKALLILRRRKMGAVKCSVQSAGHCGGRSWAGGTFSRSEAENESEEIRGFSGIIFRCASTS